MLPPLRPILAFLCVLQLILSTSAFAQNVSFQWQTDDRRHSGKTYISLLRFFAPRMFKSAFEQSRGSRDLNTKALACSFATSGDRDRGYELVRSRAVLRLPGNEAGAMRHFHR